MTASRQAILELLRDQGGLTTPEVADALGWRFPRTRGQLWRSGRSKQITWIPLENDPRTGRWYITEVGLKRLRYQYAVARALQELEQEENA